jgi:hypothetical protein
MNLQIHMDQGRDCRRTCRMYLNATFVQFYPLLVSMSCKKFYPRSSDMNMKGF